MPFIIMVIVSGEKPVIVCLLLLSCLFSRLAPHRRASSPRRVHSSSLPIPLLSFFIFLFLKYIIVDSRETAHWVLQVTQRDVISNRCHAFICSACAWRGRGLWADPLGLRSTRSQKRHRGRAADWESHSSVYRGRDAPVWWGDAHWDVGVMYDKMAV